MSAMTTVTCDVDVKAASGQPLTLAVASAIHEVIALQATSTGSELGVDARVGNTGGDTFDRASLRLIGEFLESMLRPIGPSDRVPQISPVGQSTDDEGALHVVATIRL